MGKKNKNDNCIELIKRWAFKLKRKPIIIYFIVIIAIITITLIGVGYAYFTATVTNDANTDVKVTVSDQASLTFSKGSDLSFDATMNNFIENGPNLSDTTTPSVTLIADGDYIANYYVYFQILANDFVYTTESEDAELILVITDGDGNEVTSINGLDRKTSNGVTGFDVTTKTGLFEVSNTETIALTDNKTEETENYIFTLYFINLDTNQNDNTGKTFESQIIMQAEEYDLPSKYIELNLNDVEYIVNYMYLNSIAISDLLVDDKLYYEEGDILSFEQDNYSANLYINITNSDGGYLFSKWFSLCYSSDDISYEFVGSETNISIFYFVDTITSKC